MKGPLIIGGITAIIALALLDRGIALGETSAVAAMVAFAMVVLWLREIYHGR